MEFMSVPECRVSSQRSLCAFGSVLSCVASAAQENFMDTSSEAFVPDLGRALREAFAKVRTELGERGFRDVDRLLEDAASCRSALRSLFTVPALVARRSDHDVARGDVSAVAGHGISARHREQQPKEMRVVTWNVAGGHRSAQAASRYSDADQRAAVLAEVLRWKQTFGCDIIALQECESCEAYRELEETHVLVGAVEARESRGFVHVYVRSGMSYERLHVDGPEPCVLVRVGRADAVAERCRSGAAASGCCLRWRAGACPAEDCGDECR